MLKHLWVILDVIRSMFEASGAAALGAAALHAGAELEVDSVDGFKTVGCISYW